MTNLVASPIYVIKEVLKIKESEPEFAKISLKEKNNKKCFNLNLSVSWNPLG